MPVAPGNVAGGAASGRGDDPDAWRRCELRGLSRELTDPRSVHSEAEIAHRRQRSGLSEIVEPVWDALSQASALDQLMIVTDPEGDVLWRYGSRKVRDEAEHIGFVDGADWSEASVGTNAISQALRADRAVHMSGPEHFAYSHMSWTCMAAPIRHPISGQTMGILDVSGPRPSLGREVIPMVQMSARLMSEILQHSVSFNAELPAGAAGQRPGHGPRPYALDDPGRPGSQALCGGLRLRLLGDAPAFAVGAGRWQPVPLRMAEILALLSSRQRGWTAAELAAELYGDLGRTGTVRTDMHRLRRRLGTALESQPYRFAGTTDLATDVLLVESLVRQGRVSHVLDQYHHPLLARSHVERIQQWRVWLDREIEGLVRLAGTDQQRDRWRRTELAWESELCAADDDQPLPSR